VLKSFPIVYPERCVKEVARLFLADLSARLPSLCGYSLEFRGAPLDPPQHLLTASGQLKPPQAVGTKVHSHDRHVASRGVVFGNYVNIESYIVHRLTILCLYSSTRLEID